MNIKHGLCQIDFNLSWQLFLNAVLEFRDLNRVVILCKINILEYLSSDPIDGS